MSRVPIHRLVFRWLGILLLVAAGLKLYGLAVEPVAHLGIFSAPEFQAALVAAEVLLALWLLSGVRPLGAWLVALTAFACFAVVSLHQGWVGQSSCGCFGRLSVSPWYALALDTGVVVSLVLGRPAFRPMTAQPPRNRAGVLVPAAWGLGGVVVVSGLLLAAAYLSFGSASAALASLRCERVALEPRVVDVGEGAPGDVREVSVNLTNWTDGPIRLVGGTADCSCTVLHDLPVKIPAGESRSVRVAVRMSGSPGIFTRKARFLVDDAGFKHVAFIVTGRLTASRGP